MPAYVEYAARGQNQGWRYAACLVLTFALTVVLAVLVATVLQVVHLLPADLGERLRDPGRPISFFVANGVLFGLLITGFMLAAGIAHHKRPGDLIGLWSWGRFGSGIVVWAGLLAVMALVDLTIAPSGFRLSAGPATSGLAIAALAGLSLQCFAEELIFRGYLTQALLLATRRSGAAAVISGLLFGVLHLPNGAPQAMSAALFGIATAWIAIRTRGLAFTFGLHLANNLFAAVVLVSGGDAFRGAPGVFSQVTPQLMWWDVALTSSALLAVAAFTARRDAQAHEPVSAGA